MLNIHNLSVLLEVLIYLKRSLRLGSGDVLVLLENGAGKSTMLKFLIKTLSLIRKYCRKKKNGILRQDIDFEQGRTVLEEAYEAL
jgi:ATP-binding cassette subfamily F protein 3